MQKIVFLFNRPLPIHNVIGSYIILANIRWSTVRSLIPQLTAGLSDSKVHCTNSSHKWHNYSCTSSPWHFRSLEYFKSDY